MILADEITVYLTPVEFQAFLDKFGREFDPQNPSGPSFPLWTYPETPGKFMFQTAGGGRIGEIRAIPIPGKPRGVKVEVWAEDGDWLNLKKSGDLLFNRLNQAGVIEPAATLPELPALLQDSTTPKLSFSEIDDIVY